MSEEELSNRMILIINGYKECLDYNCNQTEERQREIKYDIETLETMIDLYNKEKEKNKLLIEGKFREVADKNSYIKDNYINKDKIKEILGIEEDIDNEKLLSLLQTIVDENARLEDIEDRKVQIEYNNVFNKGVKSVEAKIKAKIEAIKTNKLRYFHIAPENWAINILQSLIEKE